MKKVITPPLFLAFLFGVCNLTAQNQPTQKIHPNNDETVLSAKDSLRYKKAVALIIQPKYRRRSIGPPHSQTFYYAYVKFKAQALIIKNGMRTDSLRPLPYPENLFTVLDDSTYSHTFQMDTITIRDEVQDRFLYHTSFPGELFTVLYDSTNPHIFKIMTNLPQVDWSNKVDSTVGTVISLDGASGLTFSYAVAGKVMTKAQDITYGEFLYNSHPDIIKGRRFFMVYEVSDPRRAILQINKPCDAEDFHAKAHNTLIGMPVLPITKLSFTYAHIIGRRWSVGVTANWIYDPLHEATLSNKAEFDRSNATHYTDNYLKFKKGVSFSGDLRWYACNLAPFGFYADLQVSYLSAQMKSNFFNKNTLKDSTAVYFASLSTDNKVVTVFSTIQTFGFQAGVGGCFFMGNSHKWVGDVGVGIKYYVFPQHLKATEMINGSPYYYHDTPAWDSFFNLPIYLRVRIYTKF